jgi:steroid delta-isomerase
MFSRSWIIVFCLLAANPIATSASADPDSDRAAITERLQRWTAAFNAHDAVGICDLFAPDLISTVLGDLGGSRNALCARLAALQAKPGLQLHYNDPDIREIIVCGDIAVVRLFWTLTTQSGASQDVTTEAGMDIFKRQPDGKWSIIRFLSFTLKPNKNL